MHWKEYKKNIKAPGYSASLMMCNKIGHKMTGKKMEMPVLKRKMRKTTESINARSTLKGKYIRIIEVAFYVRQTFCTKGLDLDAVGLGGLLQHARPARHELDIVENALTPVAHVLGARVHARLPVPDLGSSLDQGRVDQAAATL